MPPPPSSSSEDRVDDQAVEDFIYENRGRRSPSESSNKTCARIGEYSPHEYLKIPSSVSELPSGIDWREEGLFQGQESYTSFGDRGTTASVNAYGSILQISRYLDTGMSGMFCADSCRSEAYRIYDRTTELLDLSKDPNGGFGLCLDQQSVNVEPRQPRLQFLHNRWPQYTHNIGDLSVSIQYFANRGAVIQQYLFKRTQESGTKKDRKETSSRVSQGADDGVSQNLHENESALGQAQSHQSQDNKAECHGKQNHQLRRDFTQEIPAEQRQKQTSSLSQSDTQGGGTTSFTQEKVLVKDCLRLNTPLQIRESRTIRSHGPNLGGHRNDACRITLGQNEYSLAVRQNVPTANKTVELVIAIFINGRASKITKTQDGNGRDTYGIEVESEEVREFDGGRKTETDTSLEVTVAYSLRLMAGTKSCESTVIPASVLDLNDLMPQKSYNSGLSLSKSPHFDFIMKRNLEHILSVCSIPVKSRADTKVKLGGNPVALTCGDISGHHIVGSASFFAFQFLITMYSHLLGLESSTQLHMPSPNQCLLDRIFEILKGHMNWVFLYVGKDPNDNGQFFPMYGANGRPIERLRGYRTPQDTPLQIIKAEAFAKEFQYGHNVPKCFFQEVGGFVEKWIESLRRSDKRDYCVFQRAYIRDYTNEGYFLRDHVLIWKALETMKIFDEFRFPGTSHNQMLEKIREQQISHGCYCPEEARERILKRFAVQNPATNERMFATHRETQRNSFFLDTMDTVLFYDAYDFFQICGHDESSEFYPYCEEWIRTMVVQPRHEKTDDKDWQEPLRYALAIQIGKFGYSINYRSPSDMVDEALRVLLQSCSSSGMFPGFLTRETKLSSISDAYMFHYEPKDDLYWHTTFEVPYILWSSARERLEETNGQDKKQEPLEKSATNHPRNTNRRIQPQVDQSDEDQTLIPKSFRAKTALESQDFIDQRNVFEITDEWLTPCPEFLHFESEVSFNKVSTTDNRPMNSVTEPRRLIVDIPKRRLREDRMKFVDLQPRTNEELFARLQQWRTKKGQLLIKKRIIWLSSHDQEAVEICLATVPLSERLALANFFGKLNNREKYFLDSPSARRNSWKTEFQLSFYELGKQENIAQSKPEIFLAKRIRQGSIGFRFNGDFFDCYWTCHILTFNSRDAQRKGSEDPGNQTRQLSRNMQTVQTLLDNRLSTDIGSRELAITEDCSTKQTWWQRKVLELILFEEVIRGVTASTQEILEEINKILASTAQFDLEDKESIKGLPEKVKETVLFSRINGNAYFSFSAQWEVLQQLLQILDEDLSDATKKIKSWQNREENRGKETPRWTEKDERRYRPALRIMQISNAESVRELLQLQEKLQSLRTSLISRRDYIRDDLNLRGAENTRYFTYVTVVFLPLGFATGIFSMSEAPAGSTLARMSSTAAITFLLTVLVLYFVVNRLEAVNNLRATFAKLEHGAHQWILQPLARLLARFVLYVLLKVIKGSMANWFSNQEVSPTPNTGNETIARRQSLPGRPEEVSQGQPVRERRSRGDVESQTGLPQSSG